MKKFLIAWLVSTGVVILPASVFGLSFSDVQSDITINTDASITVVETITADINPALHGIYRTIPYTYTTTSGGRASIPLTITSVRQDQDPVRYSTTQDGTSLRIKIGDPQRTISGRHVYTLTYTAAAATNFFSDHDELYWNITGDQWDAPLSAVAATVHLPGVIADPALITTTCYTGPRGSTVKDCQQSHTTTAATFSAATYLTVVVGWPTGLVTKPANYDQLRTAGTQTTSTLLSGLHGWRLAVNLLLPLLALGLMFRVWWMRGRDPGQRKTIIAQYDPPDHLRPAELYCLMHEQVTAKALPASIVDLAVRGYLQIRQTEKSKLLGLTHGVDYTLRSLKAPDDQLQPYERELLTVLFAEHLFPAADPDLPLSEIKQRKYTANPFTPIFSQVTSRMVEAGYFSKNPSTVRTLWLVSGMAVIMFGSFLIWLGLPFFGVIAVGLIMLVFAGVMPRRSAPGAEAVWVGQGFRLFLATAEKYRLQWQEREHIFETFLPYAMVFGIAEKWSRALADVATSTPNWYAGQPGSTFNTMVFWGAMSNFGSSFNSSVVSVAASGGSGFGGGGFSGGGGGGGGGGGW